jgi:predicted TIM-barrel fold metal-dependent hydrolase
MLPSSAGDQPLDDPAFAPLFAAIEHTKLFAFMHPTGSYLSAGMRDFTLPIIVGWPTETSIAVTRLIFAGVLERHPALKLVLAHGGGTLPYLLGRLDLAYSAPRYEANPASRVNIATPAQPLSQADPFRHGRVKPEGSRFSDRSNGVGWRTLRQRFSLRDRRCGRCDRAVGPR